MLNLNAKPAEDRVTEETKTEDTVQVSEEERKVALAAKQAAAEERRLKMEADRKERLLAKEKAKAERKAQREASKMPMQNGVRRPKPNGKCGQAWAVFDAVSAQKGSPAAISECRELADAQGLNKANVNAEYAAWRKFYGVGGHVLPADYESKEAVKEAAKQARLKEREEKKAAREAERQEVAAAKKAAAEEAAAEETRKAAEAAAAALVGDSAESTGEQAPASKPAKAKAKAKAS
jgi:colicin import membrane protein